MNRARQAAAIFLILAVVLAAGAFVNPTGQLSYGIENTTQFAGGDGTPENPYKISELRHLKFMYLYPSASYILINDLSFSEANFNNVTGDEAAGADFYNGGSGWVAPYTQGRTFKGQFDGQGYTISGLLSKGSLAWDSRSLFGHNQGTVKNLTLRNYPFIMPSSYGYSAGSLTSWNLEGGIIQNCHVNTDMEVQQAIVPGFGFLAGYNFGLVDGCTAALNYKVTNGNNSLAGVVNVNSGVIRDCEATGTITFGSAGYNSVGGISCYNYPEASVLRCESRTNIIIPSAVYPLTVGGISAGSSGLIQDCANSGTLEIIGQGGGIAGTNDGTIVNCSNDGIIKVKSTASITTYQGIGYAGGIASVNGNEGTISQSWNTGRVIAYYGAPAGMAYAGGIAAQNEGAVSDTYNNGAVYSISALYTKTGGLVAMNTGTLARCYSTGYVENRNSVVGGVVHTNDSAMPDSIASCYYLEGYSQDQGNGEGTRLSAGEMMNPASFVGFDFENIWDMAVEGAYPYPVLRSVSRHGTPQFLLQYSHAYEDSYSMGKSLAVGSVLATAESTLTRPDDLYLAGHLFHGWYLEPDFLTLWDFSQGQMPYRHMTLYGDWEPLPFTVYFDSAGGSDVESKTVLCNRPIGEPEPPEKRGHTFRFWMSSNSSRVYLDTMLMPPSDITLTASWQVNSYKTTYHLNCPDRADQQTTNEYGKKLGAFSPLRTGYVFLGWYTEPEFINLWNFSTDTQPDYDQHLYAKWGPIEYTIAFNGNGGTGTMATVPMTYDAGKALTPCAIQRAGYTFLGWAASATGPVVYKDKAVVNNLTTTAGATVTLYAKWGPPIAAAASYGYTSIKVSWATADQATAYKIYRATSATGTYSLVYTAPSTARYWVNTGRVTGKTYYYKVCPVAGGKTYVHSTYKAARAVPATPAVTLTKPSATSIKVAWGGISGATKYQVYRSISATGTYYLVYTGSSSARSYTNSGLPTGRTYYYKVRALHLEGSTYVYGSFSAVKYLKL